MSHVHFVHNACTSLLEGEINVCSNFQGYPLPLKEVGRM